MKKPTTTEIKKARLNAQLTQKQAGEIIHHTARTWQDWERGERKMPLSAWELFLIKTNQPTTQK